MIAPSVVEEVRRLLAEGTLSYRKIAKVTGVSRGSVGAIASGRRPDYKPRPATEEEDSLPTGPPQRCPQCRGMVYMPCRLCRTRALMAQAPTAPRGFRREEPPRLELSSEHQARYEEVRSRRLQQETARRSTHLEPWMGSEP